MEIWGKSHNTQHGRSIIEFDCGPTIFFVVSPEAMEVTHWSCGQFHFLYMVMSIQLRNVSWVSLGNVWMGGWMDGWRFECRCVISSKPGLVRIDLQCILLWTKAINRWERSGGWKGKFSFWGYFNHFKPGNVQNRKVYLDSWFLI